MEFRNLVTFFYWKFIVIQLERQMPHSFHQSKYYFNQFSFRYVTISSATGNSYWSLDENNYSNNSFVLVFGNHRNQLLFSDEIQNQFFNLLPINQLPTQADVWIIYLLEFHRPEIRLMSNDCVCQKVILVRQMWTLIDFMDFGFVAIRNKFKQ